MPALRRVALRRLSDDKFVSMLRISGCRGLALMPKLLTLQVVRGVAANLVVFSHLFAVQSKYTAVSVLPPFTVYGIAGVDLFFILSGFIMVAVAGRHVGPLEFIWQRATRIYPTYWVVSLIVLGVTLIAPDLVNSSLQRPPSIWRSFLLVPSDTLPLLAVGWTLIQEIYFYIVFALMLALRIPVGIGVVVWAATIGAFWYLAAGLLSASPVLRVVTSPLTTEFIIGALIGVLWTKRSLPFPSAATIAGIAGLAISVCYIAPATALVESSHLDVWRVAIFGLPAALIIYGVAGVGSRRAPRILVAAGDWSYSTYLIHVLVISAIGRVVFMTPAKNSVAGVILMIAGGLITANVAGAVLSLGFERPSLQWLRKFAPFPIRRGRPSLWRSV